MELRLNRLNQLIICFCIKLGLKSIYFLLYLKKIYLIALKNGKNNPFNLFHIQEREKKLNKDEFIWKLLSFVCQNIDKTYCWKGKLPNWLYTKEFVEIRNKVIVFVIVPYGKHIWCRVKNWDIEIRSLVLEIEKEK